MERIITHTCDSLNRHNKCLVEEEGIESRLYNISKGDTWRLTMGMIYKGCSLAILIDYCPFCGVELNND